MLISQMLAELTQTVVFHEMIKSQENRSILGLMVMAQTPIQKRSGRVAEVRRRCFENRAV